ncbi:zonular occludens toxin domain-containing protein [Kinneretia aquatilis]|uniref:zonular occludens toxin domain-containing protein n=1 Tax=Kinneretia aquatilis TaxID=2070761 RepID=UPI0037426BC9
MVVIDECQKVPGFRPRPTSQAAPVWAEPAMETHRGKGIDLVLICQHPSQLHVGIRRLVGRHLHAVRKFGMQVSTVHEWGAVKDNCDKTRTDSIKHLYKFNKKAYAYYKSAEAHTHKRKIPFKVWVLIALLIGSPILGVVGLRIGMGLGKADASGQAGVFAPGAASAPIATVGGQAQQARASTPVEYAQAYQPRIEGLPHTAPAYDEVTKPTQAPYPAACIASKKRCGCWSQQGTKLDTPESLCRSIADGGFFIAWAGVSVPAHAVAEPAKQPAEPPATVKQ